MSEAKHTPGPWVLEDRGYKYIVSKPGDGYITRDVCRMDSSTMAAFAQTANARLIAAAPELLEALELMVAIHDEPSGFVGKYGKSLDDAIAAQRHKIDDRLATAGAAIAKAKGDTAC